MNAIHSINPAILNVHWTNVCSGYMYLIAIAMSKHDVNASELLQIQKVFAVSSWLKKEEEEEETKTIEKEKIQTYKYKYTHK